MADLMQAAVVSLDEVSRVILSAKVEEAVEGEEGLGCVAVVWRFR